MPVIGFRCFPDGFSFVVLRGTQEQPEVLAYDKVTFPRDFSWGAKLVWLRKQVLEIIRKYSITTAGLKSQEPIARRKSLLRSEVEGVVKESVYSALNRECKARIKSQLRRDIVGFTQPARYLERVLILRKLDSLNNSTYQDASLVAIAELTEQK